MHKPNLTKFVLVEIDLHFEEVKSVQVLQVIAHYMAHLDAVLEGLLLLQDFVIRAELLEVEYHFSVEGHRLIFHLLMLILCIGLEARRQELESE